MFRSLFGFSVFALALCLMTAEAGDAKKKKPVDASAFTGKITDVNLNDETKKLESLYVETTLGKRKLRRNVRINEKTKIEFAGEEKKGTLPKVGATADVKIDTETDYAVSVKISGGPSDIVPPKKKATK